MSFDLPIRRGASLLGLALLLVAPGGCKDETEAKTAPPPPELACTDDSVCAADSFCYKAKADQPGICSAGCREVSGAADGGVDQCAAGAAGSCGDGWRCNANHLCEKCPAKPCTADVECADPTTWCDVDSGQCKPGCRGDDDCNGDETCVEHVCTPPPPICTKDEDCQDPHTWCNMTVPGGRCDDGCRSNPDCPANLRYCVAGHRCTDCPECAYPCDDASPNPDLHCPPGRYCNDVFGTCEPECQNDDSCDATQVCCTEGPKVCMHRICVHRCTADTVFACAGGLECLGTGHCAEPCKDESCPPGKICQGVPATCVDGCREDAKCPQHQYCDVASTTCKAGCRASAECLDAGPNHECRDHQCQVTLCPNGHAGCPLGYYCNELQQCLAGCRDDDSCINQICNDQHACVARCQHDADCSLDMVCRTQTGHCQFGCRDDAVEPDDDRGQAHAVTFVDDHSENALLRLCSGNDDWFSVELAADQGLRVRIDYVSPVGDLGLDVLDDAGTMLARSARPGQVSQSVQLQRQPAARTVYLEVWGLDIPQFSGRDYAMTVDRIDEVAACVDDALEPNDLPGSATALAGGPLPNLVLCPTNEDWYVFHLLLGDQATATMAYTAEGLPPTFELYRAGAQPDVQPTLVAVGTAPEEAPETVVATLDSAPGTGDYFVRVSSATLQTPASYSLDLETESSSPPCVADAFPGNQTQVTAAPLPGSLYDAGWEDLMVCAGQDDWFSLELGPRESLYLEVLHDSARGNLDLELYRGVERIAVAAQQHADAERIYERGLDPGSYQIRVFGADAQQQNSYTLHVQKVLTACMADDREVDDTIEQARLLPCATQTGQLVACAANHDYHEVRLFEWTDIHATLDFLHPAGELDLALLDSAGQLLAPPSSETAQGRELGQVLPPGTYYLDVTDLEPERPNYYTLGLACAAAAPPCVQDAEEPNNDRASASWKPVPAIVLDLGICADDEDWFAFEVVEGQTLDVLITFFHFQGDLALRLYCVAMVDDPIDLENPDAISDETHNNEEITYPVTANGYCYLQVSGIPQLDSGTPYTLSVHQAAAQ